MRAAAITFGVVLLAAILLWRPWKEGPTEEVRPVASAPSSSPAELLPDPTLPGQAVPPVAPPFDPVGLTPQEIQAVREAIDNLEFVFRDFATALGGNPVGTNAEITAALRGENDKQLKLDLPAGSSLNPAGELCDPWGTPWFFHQLSSRKMEIRSAGKDLQLYTEDDFVR